MVVSPKAKSPKGAGLAEVSLTAIAVVVSVMIFRRLKVNKDFFSL
jgi:hypothetical protein